MAYAFTNLLNLADKKEDASTQPLAKSATGMTSSDGLSSGGSGSLQQQPTPVSGGAALAKQFTEAAPIIQKQVESSQGNLRTLGTKGAGEVRTQEGAYRTKNKFDATPYSADKVTNFVNTGSGDLAGLQKVLGGVGFEAPAFDATPDSAKTFSGILSGGGGQYLTQNLGGGTGALERVAGATSGGQVGQTAEEEATKLGGFAGARETAATNELGTENKAALAATQKSIRDTLAASRAAILGDNVDQTAGEQTAYNTAGEAGKDLVVNKAVDDLGKSVSSNAKGNMDANLAAVKDTIRKFLKKTANAPKLRTGKDVITADEATQLGRIGALTGEAAPGASTAADYSGQYELDPAFMAELNKILYPPGAPMAPSTPPSFTPVDMFNTGAQDGLNPGDTPYTMPVTAPMAPGTTQPLPFTPAGVAPTWTYDQPSGWDQLLPYDEQNQIQGGF